MDRITDFVDAFVPKNLPKKRKAALKEELSCHILDKKDYYREIGYDENAGIDKAIADFGDSEEINKYIYNEFEELYSERSGYETSAFIVIAVMNALCGPLGLWVASVDYNSEPGPVRAFVSSCLILAVLMMIVVARIKKYRKTLISIGIINALIAGSIIYCFYPQSATYTFVENITFLIDRFTPLSMWKIIKDFDTGDYFFLLCLLILLISALYCFTAAARIKKGKSKPVKRPVIKIAVFVALYLVFSLVSSLMQPVSRKYIQNYPTWFNTYCHHISEESQKRFDEISIGDSYIDVSECLKAEGYVTFDSYMKSLDRLTKKQFANSLKQFDFVEGCEIWFHPEKLSDGNGFVGLKQRNGIVTAKGIGNMEKNMYTDGYNYFGYTESYDNYDLDSGRVISRNIALNTLTEYLNALKKGAPETEVMSRFGEEFGTIYTKRFSVEDGKEIGYYRVYCGVVLNPEVSSNYYKEYDRRYIELTFENGKFIKGVIYDEEYIKDRNVIISEVIE